MAAVAAAAAAVAKPERSRFGEEFALTRRVGRPSRDFVGVVGAGEAEGERIAVVVAVGEGEAEDLLKTADGDAAEPWPQPENNR